MNLTLVSSHPARPSRFRVDHPGDEPRAGTLLRFVARRRPAGPLLALILAIAAGGSHLSTAGIVAPVPSLPIPTSLLAMQAAGNGQARAASADPAATPAPPRPMESRPYLGVNVRTDSQRGRCIVGGVSPGPLRDRAQPPNAIARGDFILEVNGIAVDSAEAFNTAIETLNPGDAVALKVQRTGGDPNAAIPTPGSGVEVITVTTTADARAQWAGPIAWVRSPEDQHDPEFTVQRPAVNAGDGLERFVTANIHEHQIAEGVTKLETFLLDSLRANYGRNMLSRVAFVFQQPRRALSLHEAITNPLSEVALNPQLVLNQAAVNLDLDAEAINPSDALIPAPPLNDVNAAMEWSRTTLAAAQHLVEQAFLRLSPSDREQLPGVFDRMLTVAAEQVYVHNHPDATAFMAALRSSMEVDFNALMQATALLAGAFNSGTIAATAPADLAQRDAIALPEALANAVSGSILGAVEVNGSWVIYGGPGPNTYDMTTLGIVIDPGGDDVYRYPVDPGARPDVQFVVDMAGNDRHEGTDGDAAAAASAMFGICVIVDHVGNDSYIGGNRSAGVGVMGVGLLIDHAGADVYKGASWSCGSAFYGLGAILDLANGGGDNDLYEAHLMSQGVGGPRGFGLILDRNGRDLYRANGPVGSAYGTPAVFRAFSQGVGFGIRGYDSGGIGVIEDLAGDDRYESGEFGQGGAYYWALGILHDRDGNDLYYGNRYGQAFAAHQAAGMLVDDAGDDTYWSMTAASQAGTWDMSLGLLLDRSGNDTYQADGLAQGSAAQQAIAWLVDLDGMDRYIGRGAALQGQSSDNRYHYDATGCFSFSMLLDAGGKDDLYSSARANNAVVVTGSFRESDPAGSNLHGLFVDLTTPLDLSAGPLPVIEAATPSGDAAADDDRSASPGG